VAADPGQAEAVRMLAAGGPVGQRLAAWYEDFGTPRSEPMAAPDAAEAAELTRVARALLTADGTLSGPVVEAGGRPFQAGDRVVAVVEVPGGPPVGTTGAVVEADPHLGAARVDFPTWGRVRASTESGLARVLDHDYAEVRTPQPAVDRSVVERELERLGVEVEL
ncbi:MAG: hypothetical protein M3P85_15100, partial [Actinomycetota bacterium]|nr:hypothetical protein [Actinomycetota bacterium]